MFSFHRTRSFALGTVSVLVIAALSLAVAPDADANRGLRQTSSASAAAPAQPAAPIRPAAQPEPAQQAATPAPVKQDVTPEAAVNADQGDQSERTSSAGSVGDLAKTAPQTLFEVTTEAQLQGELLQQAPRPVIETQWIADPCSGQAINSARIVLDEASGNWRVAGEYVTSNVSTKERVWIHVSAPNGIDKHEIDPASVQTSGSSDVYSFDFVTPVAISHLNDITLSAHFDYGWNRICGTSVDLYALQQCVARIVDVSVTKVDNDVTWSGRLELLGLEPGTINDDLKLTMRSEAFSNSSNFGQQDDPGHEIWADPEDDVAVERFITLTLSDALPDPLAISSGQTTAVWDLAVTMGTTQMDGNPVTLQGRNHRVFATFLWQDPDTLPCESNLLQTSTPFVFN